MTLNILSDLIRSDTLINLESLEMKGSSFDLEATEQFVRLILESPTLKKVDVSD